MTQVFETNYEECKQCRRRMNKVLFQGKYQTCMTCRGLWADGTKMKKPKGEDNTPLATT